jgi:hypothetical protein
VIAALRRYWRGEKAVGLLLELGSDLESQIRLKAGKAHGNDAEAIRCTEPRTIRLLSLEEEEMSIQIRSNASQVIDAAAGIDLRSAELKRSERA